MTRSYPEEFIQQIVIRLPVKSMIKCTSICKTWRSMIMNKSFIRAHSTTVDFANQNDVHLLLYSTEFLVAAASTTTKTRSFTR
ncbi:unnamed protein product [Prunus armeniaca]|uniref:F-box domain-containing protein n=1 Tax=Prunus armeniaca TaxID=36596 RepID=A0A6J5WCZ9_PRUAR|nr:unnamed protein product [Prunus armeniaca]